MNMEIDSQGTCRQCGNPVETGRTYCAQCMVEQVEKNIPEPSAPLPRPPEEQKARKGRLLRLLILLACLAIIGFRIPALFAAFAPGQPLRQGTHQTDTKTDQCIDNLWRLARTLQDRQEPDETIVCPASGRAYVITRSENNITARCPNPGLHGVDQISVNTNSPLPEVKP
ncbi:hypothetical protein [Desulfosudis oleivorans]|uniref:Uncharacterized protein n=1 Tax=Desulfosudis oleivorans (strain DSM 6200 / JCM 39069 / Hxd3) TaxID=96561 RepID=A8ZX40_DESOH|nr:hypothetical protein [Desulfosudis oleivorans]ABW66896.1 hypothetical protein Dole_1089 [Desulfosudis oleivorans Hxd3]